jgi:hypothetical protein
MLASQIGCDRIERKDFTPLDRVFPQPYPSPEPAP